MGAETGGLIRSGQKPTVAFSQPNDVSDKNLIAIGPLVSEIFMFESVDRRMDAGSSPIL